MTRRLTTLCSSRSRSLSASSFGEIPGSAFCSSLYRWTPDRNRWISSGVHLLPIQARICVTGHSSLVTGAASWKLSSRKGAPGIVRSSGGPAGCLLLRHADISFRECTMAIVHLSSMIDAGVEQTFAVLADWRFNRVWERELVEYEPAPGDDRRFRWVRLVGGKRTE